LILAGKVYAGDRRVEKSGDLLPADANLQIKGKDHPWVSRGGMKLARALEEFSIDVAGFTVIDIGASTGGFTDVALSNGAVKVYAVDVGHGQLAWSLRNDPRVVTLERTNARYLSQDQVPELADLIVCDVSFIGLELALSQPLRLTKPNAWLVALIKPQFEVGKENVGKGGVVRDPRLHEEVCVRATAWISALPGWDVLGIVESPIKGPAGNVEFLIVARRTPGLT
jgi:23S rRNA (cytidine1920-2'-O)/16S rRNA (cytidine1409-2'-O)-methyltransferase